MQGHAVAGKRQMLVLPANAAGKGCSNRVACREAYVDMQGAGRLSCRISQARAGKPIFAIARRCDAVFGCHAGKQPPVHVGIQPVAGGKMRAPHTKIDIGDPGGIDVGQQWQPS